jgi:hypothetical protein
MAGMLPDAVLRPRLVIAERTFAWLGRRLNKECEGMPAITDVWFHDARRNLVTGRIAQGRLFHFPSAPPPGAALHSHDRPHRADVLLQPAHRKIGKG